MKFDKGMLELYAVTGRNWIGNQTLAQQVEAAIIGGATCIQLREKHLSRDEFLREACALREICRAHNVPLIINDEVEIALQCGADGIHVGQSDMEAGDVRALVGSKMIVGVSAQNVEQALLAQSRGADYLGVGAVFPTGTKLDAQDVGREMLKRVCAAVDIPVVAIGGITAENTALLKGSGLAGIAVVSAIFAAGDITQAAQKLRAASKGAIMG